MIPVADTTISVKRILTRHDDPDTVDTFTVIAKGIRAHFNVPSGFKMVGAGAQESVISHLVCDPLPGGMALGFRDHVVDEMTGEEFEVTWARQRAGLLPHVAADVQHITGYA